MMQERLSTVREGHGRWLTREAARARGAYLQGAYLRGMDLDLSCLPLSCGGLGWRIDRRLFVQLAYHLCSMEVDDAECRAAQRALIPLANEMHRTDVPRLEVPEEEAGMDDDP